MTTTEVVEAAGAAELLKNIQPWPDRAVSMAGTIAQYVEHRRGDLAELRRMDPDEPDAAVFWRLMAQYDLLDVGEAVERKWALIIHGIALTTPTGSGEGNRRSAHDGYYTSGEGTVPRRGIATSYGFLQRGQAQPPADSGRADTEDPAGPYVPYAGFVRRVLQLAGNGAIHPERRP